MTTAEFLLRLKVVKTASSGWQACCPAHDDQSASLSITSGEGGRTLIHCHAGCTAEAVVQAIGLTLADLMPPRKDKGGKNIVATYDYTDADGKLLYQVVRFAPKDFRQRRSDPNNSGQWLWNMHGVERVLYRLPEIPKAIAEGHMVLIVEGEKDADVLVTLGSCATCNVGGAGKWQSSYSDVLVGASVVIIADKDEPGRKHAAAVATALEGKAKSIRIVELPDRDGRKVKDAADWIAAGGMRDELDAIIQATKSWTPAGSTGSAPHAGQTAGPDVDPDSTALQAALFHVVQDRRLSTSERYAKMADIVLDALHKRGRFFFHAEYKDFASAMFFDGCRKLLLNIESDLFLSWLSGFIGINRIERSFQFVLAAVQDEALTGETTGLVPEAFWASRPGAIYLSCGDGQVFRILPNKVELKDNGTDDVLFPAGRTLKPWKLVAPVDPFSKCRLWRDMNTIAPHGLDLLRLWAISLPTNQRCKPPTVCSSPVGGGKTKTAAGIFELYGLSPRISAILENGESDFWTALDTGGLCCFDNADTRVKWFPDALAAAATDGTHEKRKLYTDSGLVQHHARAWIIVTSTNPTFASDPGLADRILVIRMKRRDQDTAEGALSDEIAANRDAGLSFIARTLATALADDKPAPANLNRRHPDFATIAVKIGRAIGREAEAIKALRSAEADKGMFNLENDDIGSTLLELMRREHSFSGTAQDLLTKLQVIDTSFEGYYSAKRISKRLCKLWPHLESVLGAKTDQAHGGFKIYSFKDPNGDFGDFGEAFSAKSRESENMGSFGETPSESHQSHQNTSSEPAPQPPPPPHAPIEPEPSETGAAATVFQRNHPPVFTPEQEQLLCSFYASRPRAERLAMRRRSDYLRSEIGWTPATCDLAAFSQAWEVAGCPRGPFVLAAEQAAHQGNMNE